MSPETLNHESNLPDVIGVVKAQGAEVSALATAFDKHCDEQRQTTQRMFDRFDKLANRLPLWATLAFGALSGALGWSMSGWIGTQQHSQELALLLAKQMTLMEQLGQKLVR